jgi:hypothetical protein
LVCALSGCRAEGDAGWTGTVADSAGIVVVANPDHGLWPEDEKWTVEEDLRIGAFGGDPDYQFGQVGSIVVSSTGEILVSDRQAVEVRVFSAAGRLLRTVGSPGAGPDQFGPGTLEIMISAGDTLLVPDVANRRITRFAPDGTLLDSAPIDLDLGTPLRFNWNGASRTMSVQFRERGSPSRPVSTTSDAIRRIETSGVMGDTLLEVPSGGLFEGSGLRFFTPEPTWDVTDSSTVLFAMNSEYRILSHDRHGSLQRIITRSFEPRPIEDRDIRALFIYLDRRWLDTGVQPSRLPELHSRVGFAEFFPAFYSFHTGHQGTLWVQPVRSPADLSDEEIEQYNFFEDFGASGWDVFDADGRFLGVVEMPRRFQPRLFFEDRIYGVWRDELDVQYVVRLRILVPGETGDNL